MSSSGSVVPRKGSAEKAIPHTRIQDDAMIKDHYEVGVKIGQGNFGKVYEATHKTTRVIWAIKSINKEKAGSSALKLVEREVMILKRVNHPNIINLNEVIESPKRMYLVMEICHGGELADVLKEQKTFNETDTKQIMQRLSGAISYLHKHGIVHRDLKLENILMGANPDDAKDTFHVQVTDFGLSVVKGGVSSDSMMQDFCGTPIYMAPEILDNKSYSQQCDVWALGIIMYQLVAGYPPFRANEEAALYDLIRDAKVNFEDDEIWAEISEPCKSCIQGMLKVDPAHRLSASEVLNHPWITGEERDTSQPTNVLEMMKLWKDELKADSLDDKDSSDAATTQLESLLESPTPVTDQRRPIGTSSPDKGHAKDIRRRTTKSPPVPSSKSYVSGVNKKVGLTAPKTRTSSASPKPPNGNGVVKSSSGITASSSKTTASAPLKSKKK